jgi:DNA primase
MTFEDMDNLSELELCKKIELQSLIEEHGQVMFIPTNYKKRKNLLIADCPFHLGDKGKCLSVAFDNENKQYFNCFACGRHGNAVDFILQQLRVNYPNDTREDAIEALKDYLESKTL